MIITGIAISLVSYHFHKDPTLEYNEVNPGVFVELNHDYVVGMYRNSYSRNTVLVARQFHFGDVGGVRFGALLGGCTGYNSPVCGSFTVGAGPVTLAVIPPISKTTTAVVGLSWSQKL